MEHYFACKVCGKKADKLSWPGAVYILNADDPKLHDAVLVLH